MILSEEDCAQFFGIYRELLAFANRVAQVIPEAKTATDVERLEPEDVVAIRRALFETLGLYEVPRLKHRDEETG